MDKHHAWLHAVGLPFARAYLQGDGPRLHAIWWFQPEGCIGPTQPGRPMLHRQFSSPNIRRANALTPQPGNSAHARLCVQRLYPAFLQGVDRLMLDIYEQLPQNLELSLTLRFHRDEEDVSLRFESKPLDTFMGLYPILTAQDLRTTIATVRREISNAQAFHARYGRVGATPPIHHPLPPAR